MPGYRVFANNAILTAAEVNSYLMRQAVIYCADATARAAISAPTAGMVIFLATDKILYIYLTTPQVAVNGWYPLGGALPHMEVDGAAAKSIPNAAWTLLDTVWGVPIINRGYTSFTSGVITVAQAGLYEASCQIGFASMGSTPRIGVQMTKNSTAPDVNVILKATVISQNTAESRRVTKLAAGDTVRAFAYQDSGSARNTLANVESHLALQYVAGV